MNEKGEEISFIKHMFLLAIYDDQSDNLVVTKAAQVGLSTLEILKNIHDAKVYQMDIIYTLPSDSDVTVFVSGKVNRIILNNQVLADYTKDQDSIEQKKIGKSQIYFRGTWTKKAANMVTADRLVHDEKDSSKQEVISDYQARMQHSKFKQTHVFSHPSTPNHGVDIEWKKSDQKEWFITCPHCHKEHYLEWNTENDRKMSINMETREYVCKLCKGVLTWKDRAKGRWRPRYKNFLPDGTEIKWSGYHISLLMAPWVTAGEIIDKYNDPQQAPEFFYNKVLGLPFAGSGNAVTEDTILGSVTKDKNEYKGRMVVGVDTGIKLRYVIGNRQGLVGYGEMTDYMPDDVNKLPLEQTLEYFLKKFPDCVMIFDQNGDITAPRKFQKKYPGRVFLCNYQRDKKTMQLIKWGEKDETGVVHADRNRMIQWVINEFVDRRIKLYNGTNGDWYNYWLHWSHIYRETTEDELGLPVYKWRRSDRDDWVHATVYWRIGIERFGQTGSVSVPIETGQPDVSYMINPDDTVDIDPNELFKLDYNIPSDEDNDEEWR